MIYGVFFKGFLVGFMSASLILFAFIALLSEISLGVCEEILQTGECELVWVAKEIEDAG